MQLSNIKQLEKGSLMLTLLIGIALILCMIADLGGIYKQMIVILGLDSSDWTGGVFDLRIVKCQHALAA